MPIRIIRANNLKSKYDVLIVDHSHHVEMIDSTPLEEFTILESSEELIDLQPFSVNILGKELVCKHLWRIYAGESSTDYQNYCISCIEDAIQLNDTKICIVLPDTFYDWMPLVDRIANLEENDDILVHIWITCDSGGLNEIPYHEDLKQFIQNNLDNSRRQTIKNAIVDFLVKTTKKGVLPTAPHQKVSHKDDGLKPNEKAELLSQLPKDAPSELMTYMKEQLDESFWSALNRMRQEKGLSHAQCYKRANVTRQLYSKIRSNSYYKPRKQTAFAFAIALSLDLEKTNELLGKASLSLSDSEILDLIVKYHIEKQIYNVHEINEVLFAFDQSLLGGQ